MKSFLKITLLSLVAAVGLLALLFFVFDYTLVKYNTTGEIEFSAQQEPQQPLTESLHGQPKNIIFIVADGMGFNHMSLSMMAQQQTDQASVWQNFDVKSWHDPRCGVGPITDSGASATAMATGQITNFEVIGMDADGNSVQNAFEIAAQNGYETGIVTDSYIWDATPAAFVAHTQSRDNSKDILTQIAASELDLIFGELEDVGEDQNPDYKTTMEIINRRFSVLSKDLNMDGISADTPIAAIYDEDEIQDLDSSPNLVAFTQLALNRLSAKGNPFMLLIECEELDSASHRNDTQRTLNGLEVIKKTLETVQDFANSNGETLVVFTSDHETGGLSVVVDYNAYPLMGVKWGTLDHTAAVVPLFAMGPGAQNFAQVERNWQIGILLKDLVAKDKKVQQDN